MSEILRTPIPGDKQQKYMFANHKLKFFFGDLNFRLRLENEDVRPELEKRNQCNLAFLIENDELYQWLVERNQNAAKNRVNRLLEGQIMFHPTYKYNKQSNEYDTSKKMRVPAWCDRVLWVESENIRQAAYERSENWFSDHRPVRSSF